LTYSGTVTLKYKTDEEVGTGNCSCPKKGCGWSGKCSDAPNRKCPNCGTTVRESTTTRTTEHTKTCYIANTEIIVDDAGSLTIPQKGYVDFMAILSAYEGFINTYQDQFIYAVNILTGPAGLYEQLNNFINTTASYVNTMKSQASFANYAHSGAHWPVSSPPSYNWTDSRGSHTVSINTGDWIPPKTKKTEKKSWGGLKKKTCVRLKCYEDEDYAWIEIIRKDDLNQEIKSRNKGGFILGIWNPAGGSYSGTIRRKAWAGYGHSANGWYLKLKKTER